MHARYDSMFLQELFCFVDLRSQVRATTSVRVVQEHELTVILPYFLFRQHSFAEASVSRESETEQSSSTSVVGSETPLFGSFSVRNHPYSRPSLMLQLAPEIGESR